MLNVLKTGRKKKFGDKWYDFDMGCSAKAEARERANRWRSGGANARIVQIPGIQGWFVYKRKK
jgi:hypothetical protein